MAKESITIIAKDGYELQGAYFSCENKEKSNPPTIAIQPAFGIKCGFYSPLAKFLAQENHVFIFDYRGIGESGDPKLVTEGMHAWATLDMVAVHSHIESRFPNSDFHIFGHSGGAWLLGFIPPPKNLKSLLFLCMPDGYFNSFSFPNNLRLYLIWKFLIPRNVKKNGILANGKYYSAACA